MALFLLFSVIDDFEWFWMESLHKSIQLMWELSMLMTLLSILSVIGHLICGNKLNWLLNLYLIYETLWTGVGSGLLISVLGKLSCFVCINVVKRCFDIASTSDTDVVSTLCNVKNPTSDFVSFSTSDQRYFNVDPQRWNNLDPTSKCWLGLGEKENAILIAETLHFSEIMLLIIFIPYPVKYSTDT